MTYQLFSATGCTRCSIVKRYMDDKGAAYEELDIKAGGKEAFKVFYRENRPDIFRGEEGVAFPILFDGKKITQGVGPILAYLSAGSALDNLVGISLLSREWIGGFSLCADAPDKPELFVDLLRFIKAQGLLIELEADGRNAALLSEIIRQGLVDRLRFWLRGPARLYHEITGQALGEDELDQSLSLLGPLVPEYKILVPVAAFLPQNGTLRYLTPEEAAEAAQFAASATGSKTHPFFIRPAGLDEARGLDLPEPAVYFKYRTACRRYMVRCDILKTA